MLSIKAAKVIAPALPAKYLHKLPLVCYEGYIKNLFTMSKSFESYRSTESLVYVEDASRFGKGIKGLGHKW